VIGESVGRLASLVAATVQPEVKREPKEKRLNERKQVSPTIACSRHGSVREFRLHVGTTENVTSESKSLRHDGDCGLR
jgi:hypothetical protein